MITPRQALPFALALFVVSIWVTVRTFSKSPQEFSLNDPADSLHDDYALEETPSRLDLSDPALVDARPQAGDDSSKTWITFPEPEALYDALIPKFNALLSQPILSHTESLKKEHKRCPLAQRQSNQDQVNGEGPWWASVSTKELEKERARIMQYVVENLGFSKSSLGSDAGGRTEGASDKGTSLSREAWKDLFGFGGQGGRGLVFTAGNQDTTARLRTTLRILRKRHKCKLPVEVWGFPSELNALGPIRREIEELGDIVFREVHTKVQPGLWKQFHLKGEAIARSAFTEVLYLDSDNIPIRDPAFIFDAPLYEQHGFVLWPDFTKDGPANPIWRITNTPCNATEWQAESGQILVNKRGQGGLNLVALLIAEAMQLRHQFWFKLSGGDKDTFRYAFYVLGIPYTRAPHWVASVGALVPPYNYHHFCGHTMLQYGLSSAEWSYLDVDADYEVPKAHAPPLFMHANLLKHSGYNNQRGSTFESIKAAFPDSTGYENARLMKDVRAKSENHRGICFDLWDADFEAGEGNLVQLEGAYDLGRVHVFDFGESWGGVLRNFEQMYYDEGGIAGGW
ncbi:hypothetical protein T439DRAFT_346775 [Meredithblackwellia eburnea MCA 4105]